MTADVKTQASGSGTERSAKILAKSFYRQLRENGYTHNQVVSMASELISLVTQEMREGAPTARA